MNERRRKWINYQKAVKLKKLIVVAMEAIDPAAKMNCEILRTSPRTVPGVPEKSFIFLFQIKSMLRNPQIPNNENPSSDSSPMQQKQITKEPQKVRLLTTTSQPHHTHHTKSQANRKIRHRNREPEWKKKTNQRFQDEF